MSGIIYEFELSYNGNNTSWEFNTAQERDNFYALVVDSFSEKEYKNKNEALAKGDFIQISVANVREDSLDSMADIVPYAFYDGKIYDELKAFINKEYNR